jgi:hypothetical protein
MSLIRLEEPRILHGLILLAVAVSVAACPACSGERGLEAEILSPEAGSTHPPGNVIVRLLATDGEDPPGPVLWELSYRRLEEPPSAWTLIAEGDSIVSRETVGRYEVPAEIDARRESGVEVLELDEAGRYEIRLSVTDRVRAKEVAETVEFTVQ